MPLRDFQTLSKLGEGAFSTVYKVRRGQDGNVYALKRVNLGSLSAKQKQNALNQIRILASIDHPNIIGYKQAFIDEPSKSLCIVMEFATNGDLATAIAQQSRLQTYLHEKLIWKIFIQMVKGLRQLHELKIFHRDIKTANIYLHEGDIAKLGDMNVSKISEQGLCVTQTGTPYYASPEVWKDLPYDEKSDIWSLGCVLYEMICLKLPFKAEDMQGLYKKVTRGIYPKIPSEYSQQLSSMIRLLLQVNPDQRPSCDKIMKMPIIQKYAVQGYQTQFKKERTKTQLIKSIKAQSLQSIIQNLPKSNYQSMTNKKKLKKHKSIVELVEQKQTKIELLQQIYDIQSLPILQKQKRMHSIQNTDRVMSKDKSNIQIINRDRKKSDMGHCKSQIQVTALHPKLQQVKQLKQLKLPKVQNRYNRNKQKTIKYTQNSLRCQKLFE